MPNKKSYKLNTTIMPNNNEKKTMAQAFYFEDGLKGLKILKKYLLNLSIQVHSFFYLLNKLL